MIGIKFQDIKSGHLLLIAFTFGFTITAYLFFGFKNDLSTWENIQPVMRIFRSKTCTQPELHPFKGDFFKKYFKTVLPYKCSTVNDWLETYNGSVYITRSMTSADRQKTKCYIQYVRRLDDNRVTFSEKVTLIGDQVLRLKDDFFRASCTQNDTTYKNVHAGISYKSKGRVLGGETNITKGLGLSILMIGFDSMSHMTYIRKLPKTYRYLNETLNGFILNGFNAIGDGTGENLTPLFTGKNENELPSAVKTKPNAKHVDSWPFIWKDLRRHGYVTAFSEDCTRVTVYNYRLKGFKQQPTDHYMRPFYLAAEKTYNQHKTYCLGSKRRTQVLFNYIKEFQLMYRDKPKFMASFHAELSHDFLNRVQSADGDLLDLIMFLNENNILNNTMLILFSDHGMRFGSSRAHPQGKLEQLLPFFSITLPPWFRKKYPVLVNNLKMNTDRLTTGFDVHEMFHDMVSFSGSGLGNLSNRGISLFKEVPVSRTCVDAGIGEELCTCTKWAKINISDSRVKKASEFAVSYINKLSDKHRDLCERLNLQKTTAALSKVTKFNVPSKFDVYQVVTLTNPGGGLFETTVKMDHVTESMQIDGTINRINRYNDTSKCIISKNVNLLKFCYCKKMPSFK